VQIGVDLFSFAPAYSDLASLSTLAKYTGGQVYYFPSFGAQRDGVKLKADLTHNLLRETGWEAVMRIRCSRGLRISSFHGHFFIRSTDLLALPVVDGDKAYAVQIAHEENVMPTQHAYVQVSVSQCCHIPLPQFFDQAREKYLGFQSMPSSRVLKEEPLARETASKTDVIILSLPHDASSAPLVIDTVPTALHPLGKGC